MKKIEIKKADKVTRNKTVSAGNIKNSDAEAVNYLFPSIELPVQFPFNSFTIFPTAFKDQKRFILLADAPVQLPMERKNMQ